MFLLLQGSAHTSDLNQKRLVPNFCAVSCHLNKQLICMDLSHCRTSCPVGNVFNSHSTDKEMEPVRVFIQGHTVREVGLNISLLGIRVT